MATKEASINISEMFKDELAKMNPDMWVEGVRELKAVMEKRDVLALPDFTDKEAWEDVFTNMSNYDVGFLGKAIFGVKEWNDKWRPIPVTAEMWPAISAQLVELLGCYNPKTKKWSKQPTKDNMEEVEVETTTKKTSTKKKVKTKKKVEAKKKTASKKKTSTKKKTAAKKTTATKRVSFPDDAKITIIKKQHPFREGTVREVVFKTIKNKMTVGTFVKNNKDEKEARRELKRFVKKGLVKVA